MWFEIISKASTYDDPEYVLKKTQLMSKEIATQNGISRCVRRYQYRYFLDFAATVESLTHEWNRIAHYSVWTDGKTIIKAFRDSEAFNREINNYRLLNGKNIVPELIRSHGYPYEDEDEDI